MIGGLRRHGCFVTGSHVSAVVWRHYPSAMSNLPAIGALAWFLGIAVLIVNTIGDSGTPTVSHVDFLGLALSVSGAILARGAKA